MRSASAAPAVSETVFGRLRAGATWPGRFFGATIQARRATEVPRAQHRAHSPRPVPGVLRAISLAASSGVRRQPVLDASTDADSALAAGLVGRTVPADPLLPSSPGSRPDEGRLSATRRPPGRATFRRSTTAGPARAAAYPRAALASPRRGELQRTRGLGRRAYPAALDRFTALGGGASSRAPVRLSAPTSASRLALAGDAYALVGGPPLAAGRDPLSVSTSSTRLPTNDLDVDGPRPPRLPDGYDGGLAVVSHDAPSSPAFTAR